jgi:hypothetical protein
MTHTIPFWISVAGLSALAGAEPGEGTFRGLNLGIWGRAGFAVGLILMALGSAFGMPQFSARSAALLPAREALRGDQDPALLARLHPELHQVYANIGVLQRRRLSVFRNLSDFKPTPARMQPLRSFRQYLVPLQLHPVVDAACEFSATIKVVNPTLETWPRVGDESGAFAVHLSYHWLAADGTPVVFDGIRTQLPRNLEPGSWASVRAQIAAPEVPGGYILQLSMVQEHVAWFNDPNAPPLDIRMTVLPVQ